MEKRVLDKNFVSLMRNKVQENYEDIDYFFAEYSWWDHSSNKIDFLLVSGWEEYDALTEQDKEEISNYILEIFNQGKELFSLNEIEFGNVGFTYEV